MADVFQSGRVCFNLLIHSEFVSKVVTTDVHYITLHYLGVSCKSYKYLRERNSSNKNKQK